MTKPLLLAALLASAHIWPAQAAERSYTVTSFDRLRVDGPFRIEVTSGRGSSARAIGDPRAIDGVSIRVEGRTMIVRRDTSAWGGMPGAPRGTVTIALGTQNLTSIWVSGAGSVAVDRMKGGKLDLAVDGPGRIDLAAVSADWLGVAISGSGGMRIGGTTSDMRVAMRGSGDLDATALTASDAEIVTEGSGAVRLNARRAAKVTSTGAATVEVAGDIGCTVKNLGSGVVNCGRPGSN